MEKARSMLRKIGLYRPKPAEDDDLSLFDKRLKKVNRAREYNAVNQGPGFKNPPSQSKA